MNGPALELEGISQRHLSGWVGSFLLLYYWDIFNLFQADPVTRSVA